MHGILRTPSLLGAPFVHLAIEIPILRIVDRTTFHSLLIQRIRLGEARLHLKVARLWAWCPPTYSSHDKYMELESIVWHLVAAVPSEIVGHCFPTTSLMIGESTLGHFVFRLAALKKGGGFAAS
jgi:hypothetical protein